MKNKGKNKKNKTIEVEPMSLSRLFGHGKPDEELEDEKPRKKHHKSGAHKKVVHEDGDDSDPVVGGVAGALLGGVAGALLGGVLGVMAESFKTAMDDDFDEDDGDDGDYGDDEDDEDDDDDGDEDDDDDDEDDDEDDDDDDEDDDEGEDDDEE